MELAQSFSWKPEITGIYGVHFESLGDFRYERISAGSGTRVEFRQLSIWKVLATSVTVENCL